MVYNGNQDKTWSKSFCLNHVFGCWIIKSVICFERCDVSEKTQSFAFSFCLVLFLEWIYFFFFFFFSSSSGYNSINQFTTYTHQAGIECLCFFFYSLCKRDMEKISFRMCFSILFCLFFLYWHAFFVTLNFFLFSKIHNIYLPTSRMLHEVNFLNGV